MEQAVTHTDVNRNRLTNFTGLGTLVYLQELADNILEQLS